MNSSDTSSRRSWLLPLIAALCFLAAAFLLILFYAARTAVPPEPSVLTAAQSAELAGTIARELPAPGLYISAGSHNAGQDIAETDSLRQTRVSGLRSLPYTAVPPALNINAESAILIDAETGSVLYEKNADAVIPPASMTKLVVMYVAFQEISAGRLRMEDQVALPPETWAVNAPPRSSLMFLGEGQRVTVEELLEGLAVASGNDAAVALALRISGSVDAFCLRMTNEMRLLGLTVTTFVEPSGYSEHNVTTAREFASFARVYVNRYPESLEAFHSLETIAYPRQENMLSPTAHARTIVQYSSNKLLGTLEGCDGLKTGYIDESGYNISLTAERDGTRFISVTMGGPGRSTSEGNFYRVQDGTALMEWGFSSFQTVRQDMPAARTVKVIKGNENSVRLVEAWPDSLTAPAGEAESVTRRIISETEISAPVKAGTVYGSAVYEAGGRTLQEIPLVADRDVERGSWLKVCMDVLSRPFSSLFVR